MSELGKRQMERFSLNVPAIISPKDVSDPARKSPSELRTRNLCSGGAFLITDNPLQVGTEVDVNILLSLFAGNIELERQSNIHVSGSVIRVEPGGMAIKFDDNYQIFPASKAAPV